MNTSKISVETRRALVKPVTEFARAHNQPVSLIMAAVLWVGETKPEQILSLVNGETLQTYRRLAQRRTNSGKRGGGRRACFCGHHRRQEAFHTCFEAGH